MTRAMTWPLLGVLLLAVLHLLAGTVHAGKQVRPSWMSAAGGLSIAYVFIDLMPELAEAQARWLEARPHRMLFWLERQVYLAALIGALGALGVERAVSARGPGRAGFWVHVASFAVYNVLVGASSLRLTGAVPTALAVLAFGAHFLINDHRLTLEHGGAYARAGRWVFASSIVVGWLMAAVLPWPPVVNAALLGLLSGGIILDILQEELSEARTRRYSAFAIAALGFAALLIALGYSLRGR